MMAKNMNKYLKISNEKMSEKKKLTFRLKNETELLLRKISKKQKVSMNLLINNFVEEGVKRVA